ncbi:MAG TPA: PAS domain S-box protein [Gemmataceae bacterium]|nr:PAS domain S-box protein [Gemmataceae bacterium]
MTTPSLPRPARYVVAVGFVALAVAVRALLGPVLGDQFPFATVFFAVLAAAWVGGRGPAFLALALGAGLSAWFLLPPRTFTAAGGDQQVGLALYLAIGVGIALLGGAMREARQRAEAAAAETAAQVALWRATLASIGDAVVVTDDAGRVTFVNPVAESLTGWPAADARGRELADVFRAVNESTREPVENPALRAISEGVIVGLANHTVLISRDGTERPIDDSAAPIRDIAGAVGGAVLVFRDISERYAAEARVRAKEERLRLITDSVPALISYVGRDLRYQLVNHAYETWFGHPREELVGRTMAEVLGDDAWAVSAPRVARAFDGETVVFDGRMAYRDGGPRWVEISYTPDRDTDGGVRGVVALVHDITERKRAEDALRESDARHRFLVELAGVIQPLTDPDAVMAATARALAEHLGADRCAYAEVEDEAVFVITGDHTRGVPSIVGRWPVADFGPEVERLMSENRPYVIDDVDADPRAGTDLTAYRATNIRAVICVPLHKAGTFVAAMAVHQKTPRRWTAAEVELVRIVVGRSWESIERAKVARGLREAADRLALALAAANLGDWSWDAATDVVSLTERSAEIFGVPPGPHTTWARLQELLHEDDRARTRAAVEDAVARRTQYDVEYRVTRPDGVEAWVAAMGRAQYDPAGRPLGMFGVVQDVTARKHLEEELRRRAEELAATDRRKDDFIALLAHELRNPLAPIRNGVQILRMSGDESVRGRAQVMMERQLGHMVRLIEDLLDISRVNRNKMELRRGRVALADAVASAVETVRPEIEAAGHALTVTLPPEPVYLDADLTRLAQVFGNLLSNSAKYMPRGGRISLNAECGMRNAESTEVRNEQQPGAASPAADSAFRIPHSAFVEIAVRDTGIGIPPASLPRIFDMFSQVDRTIERATGGLGIGLALVKGLVEMHGGSVTAASEGEGLGSLFTVRLPVLDGPRPPAPADEPGESGVGLTGRRILVVDDNRDSAVTMSEMLRLLGNEIALAHDGEEGVERASEFRPDLILMDIGMPKLNGLDATRRVRQLPGGDRITIVALTGWGKDADRARSREAGCDAHLVKPIDLAELRRVVGACGPPTEGVA